MSCLQKVKLSEKRPFFNLNDSSLGRHVNATSRKSLEIQAYPITEPRTLVSENLYEN